MAKTAFYMATYRARKRNASTPQAKAQAQAQQVATQAPTSSNTPVLAGGVTTLSQMTDDELANLVNTAKGIYLPNQLADVQNMTQSFVYAAGLNGKPLVLDDTEFAQFMADNNIPRSEILARSISPIQYTNQQGTRINMSTDRISRMLKDSRLNYIGGKVGGSLYGSGTYFSMNGGSNTGYGSVTMNAVLNPSTAHVISEGSLYRKASSFARYHPKFARAVGSITSKNESIYALAMGYNVITSGNGGVGEYHNVIDRTAIVYRRNDH